MDGWLDGWVDGRLRGWMDEVHEYREGWPTVVHTVMNPCVPLKARSLLSI